MENNIEEKINTCQGKMEYRTGTRRNRNEATQLEVVPEDTRQQHRSQHREGEPTVLPWIRALTVLHHQFEAVGSHKDLGIQREGRAPLN